MKFLTYFESDGSLSLGIALTEGVLAVARAANETGLTVPQTPAALLETGCAAVEPLARLVGRSQELGVSLLDESTLRLGPAVPTPGKIICIGLNYARHAREAGAPVPEVPVVFSKFSNTICAPGEPVPLPASAEQYDYEVELGVVIGRRTRNVAEPDALDHVLGYTVVDDLSTRDLQMRTSQWLLGKTQDKFLPVGPYLVTADEVGDPQSMGLRCWVNGTLRQSSSTRDMIFSVGYIIHYVSRYFTLEPGDLICTGTPEGVALGQPSPVWLRPGDVVTVEIDRLGSMTNQMVEWGERG